MLLDRYGNPVSLPQERRALGFTERTLPEQETPNEPPCLPVVDRGPELWVFRHKHHEPHADTH